jgi:hypothetical protein
MREPAVAGQFYPADTEKLLEMIEGSFLHPLGPGTLPEKEGEKRERGILGAVVPHAGYPYSGPEAACVYRALAEEETPTTVVLIGPNHTGYGSPIGISREDWKTPLGIVRVDLAWADELVETVPTVEYDELSHQYEHSIEVQLPFLQYIYGDFRILPISLGAQSLETADRLGSALADREGALILASSDFTHYEDAEEAVRKDHAAIDRVLALDEEGFLQKVYDLRISICGFGPIAACLKATKEMGATGAELLRYGTSGDITGDHSRVVAYAAIVFRKG